MKEFNKDIKNIMHINSILTKSSKNALLNLTKSSFGLGWYEIALASCNSLLKIDPKNGEAQQLLKTRKEQSPPKMEFLKRLLNQANMVTE